MNQNPAQIISTRNIKMARTQSNAAKQGNKYQILQEIY